jgi:hypothetical protein
MLLQEIIKNSSKKKILVLIFLLSLFRISFSQEITIKCEQEPLNEILIELSAKYGIMFSFDDAGLSSFIVTVSKTFPSIKTGLDHLLDGLPLRYENSNGVYVIYKIRVRKEPVKFILEGRITDIINHETLPFAGLQINGILNGSDSKGNFSFISSSDSVFNIRISYIGYYHLDTIVKAGLNYNFRLTPSVIGLKEIIVKGSSVTKTIQTGTSPGIIQLNHKISYYLPGNGDNSVFNLLRLQPGILASGEQSADLIIWGSYEGQSQVVFDGFTVYGMKNFNDNISAVNPFMAKDIRVLKGGFGAEYGERVGGIVDITGNDGNRLAPSVQFCINNMTVNGIASTPVTKNSAVLLAYRQTYYNLYNPVNFSTSGYGRGRQSSGIDYFLTPDYLFRDLNLKFSAGGENNDFYISLYGGRDGFSYDFNKETMQKKITLSHSENNQQLGGTLFYGLRWKNRITSQFKTSFSSLQTDRTHIEDITRTSGSQVSSSIHNFYNVRISEINGRIENTFYISEKHRAEAGTGILYYFTTRDETTLQQSFSDVKKNLTILYLYLQDNFRPGKKFTIRPGMRMDYHSLSGNVLFQPRLSVLYTINDRLRLNSAIGIYNQFVAKNMIIEPSGNFRLEWSVCDGSEISVLNSKSFTIGFTYNKNGYTFSTEGYLKNTEGISRYVETSTSASLYKGDGKIKGLDIFIKKDFRNQTFWISYTLSKTTEYFQYFPAAEFVPAMHDQRHELKMAGLTKFKSFHFSVNYVYGSGFPDPDKLPDEADYTKPYSRLDAALIYAISNRKIKVDAGISVLNVLNRENIRYSNYTRIPADETTTINLYAEAVPLTPTIFLSISF